MLEFPHFPLFTNCNRTEELEQGTTANATNKAVEAEQERTARKARNE